MFFLFEPMFYLLECSLIDLYIQTNPPEIMHNLLLGRAPHKSVYSLFAPLQKPTKQIPIKQNSNTA